MLKHQIIGTINLSVPLIIVALSYPNLLINTWCRIICALATGLYLLFLNYKTTKQQAASLTYSPTEAALADFEAMITACNVDPKSIQLRYSYSNEGIAQTMFNTITIDPLLWQGSENDPSGAKVKAILEEHIVPPVPAAQKERMRATYDLLSLPVQRFIFKHELGHVVSKYGYKKLVVIGIVGSLATYTGVAAALALQAYVHAPGVAAVFFGMFIGGCSDLLFTYASNFLFKLPEEKNADRFAIQHSSPEEIEAAAQFWEDHAQILAQHPNPTTIFSYLPTTIGSGYLPGPARAAYLRQHGKTC